MDGRTDGRTARYNTTRLRRVYKKLRIAPRWKKIKKKIYYVSVITKIVSPHVFKISEISFVLYTGEITDIFNQFNDIYLVFTSKKLICSMYSFP